MRKKGAEGEAESDGCAALGGRERGYFTEGIIREKDKEEKE